MSLPVRLMVATILLLLPCSVTAESSSDPFGFDLVRRDSSLYVKVDLSPLLGSEHVRQMKEGIDISLSYELVLTRPRRLWGAREIARRTGALVIGHRIVNEDYLIQTGAGSAKSEHLFPTLAGVHRFLADSVTLNMVYINSIEGRGHLVLRIKVTSISLTSINIGAPDDDLAAGDSPLKYLFREFLVLTGFGREEYNVRSRPFSISEIDEEL